MYTHFNMSDLHENRVAFPTPQSNEHLQSGGVAFNELANMLGYEEDQETHEIHRLCIEADYRDEKHYGESVLSYIRRAESILYSSEVQNRPNRLEVRQGIWLSIADIHYATGHYSNCLEQLFEVHDDILHSNDATKLGTISWMIHHVGAKMTGKQAIAQDSKLSSGESTVDFTTTHFDIAS